MPYNNEGKLCGKGKSTTKYCFTNQDIADCLGISLQHTRLLIRQGKLNPHLSSIISYYINKYKKYNKGEPTNQK